MSTASVSNQAKSAKTGDSAREGTKSWLSLAIVIIAAGVLSGFYAINEYAGGTGILINNARANAERFEGIYRVTSEKRLNTLRFVLEILSQDDEIVGAFRRDERVALAAKVVPLFKEVLHARYGMDQLNFFTPPATVYLRADDPAVMGHDLSAVRKTVVMAAERRQMVSGMETGLGGVVALRAVIPVLDDGRVVGTMGVGDAITDFLNAAAATSGMEYALGLDRAIADKAERAPDPAKDAIQGKDVFFAFSSPLANQVLRQIEINPRASASELRSFGTRTIFIKTFSLNNFSGVPTVVVATLLDLTEGFSGVQQTTAVKSVILFLLVSIIGSVGIIRFRAMREGLRQVLMGQRLELAEKTAALEAAQAKLQDAEQLKRSFLANLAASLSEPLQAVAGQLRAIGPSVEAALQSASIPNVLQTPENIVGSLRAALWETTRASRHLSDYQQLELFRQGLVRIDTPLVALHLVAGQLVREDLAVLLRLTHLTVEAMVPSSLPRTRADAGLLRRALAALVIWVAQCGASGRLTITAVSQDAWLYLTLTGPIFPPDTAPGEALLSRIRRATTQAATPEDSEVPLGLVLAAVIIEFLGGSLSTMATHQGRPGFIVRLLAAR